MRVIRFDPLGGASGDMILGALAGIGADLHGIFQELSAQLPDPVGVVVSPADSHGLHGLRASVSTESAAHDRWVDVSPHAGAQHGGGHHHHPEHRTLADVANLLGGRHPLALRVFERLAEAEGRVHGRDPSAVHFHEVGALDAIADIAGACLALRQLGVDGVAVGPLPCGTGTLTCAHGIMPNPAPATLLLLEGMETVQTDEPSELVTPTAAALFAIWTRELTPPPPRLRVIRSAFGFGRRTLAGRPNALRATLLETEAAGSTPNASGTESDLCVLEANLDDCNPQWVGDLIARTLAAGACDAWATPATFKKARPGIVFSVLAPSGLIAAIEGLVFTATTTFGVRRYPVSRSILDRRFETVSTPWGPVRIKIGSRDGRDLVRTPEYEDCARLADTAGITPRQVYETAARSVTSA
jgi:uncharacterized protein (TIGR00299 family) protein